MVTRSRRLFVIVNTFCVASGFFLAMVNLKGWLSFVCSWQQFVEGYQKPPPISEVVLVISGGH